MIGRYYTINPVPLARVGAKEYNIRQSAYLTRDHRLGVACRGSEAGEPTGAREHVCGPDVILTAGVKGAREDARVKIMSVGCPQTAGRASRSGEGLFLTPFMV